MGRVSDFSKGERRALVRRWQRSRMGRGEFAQRQGVSAATLWRWERDLAAESTKAGSGPQVFVEIEIIEEGAAC